MNNVALHNGSFGGVHLIASKMLHATQIRVCVCEYERFCASAIGIAAINIDIKVYFAAVNRTTLRHKLKRSSLT